MHGEALRDVEQQKSELEHKHAEAVREGVSNAKGRAIEISKVTRLVGDKARLIEEQSYLESKVLELEALRVAALEEVTHTDERAAEAKVTAAAELERVEGEVARLNGELREQRARHEAVVAGLQVKIEMQQADSEATITERLADEKMAAELEVRLK